MTEEIGTLEELNVKAGDVVQHLCYDDGGVEPYAYPFRIDERGFAVSDHDEGFFLDKDTSTFRVISRAPATPRTWAEMTDAEKGALLLAKHEGKKIESFTDGQWMMCIPLWGDDCAYRVRPEPKRETVALVGGEAATLDWGFYSDDPVCETHRITFDLIDGEPDPASIKMERIE